MNYLDYYQSLVKIIRDTGDFLLVIGGSAFTIFPEYFLEDLALIMVLLARGICLCETLEDIETGNAPKEKLLRSSTIKDINLDSFPTRRGFDVKRYFEMGGCINIQLKRGCAFNCSYCTYPAIEGHAYRKRSPEKIIEEIQYWHDQGITHYFFVDSVFNHPEDYALQIVNEIVRKLKIHWTGFLLLFFRRICESLCQARLTSMDWVQMLSIELCVGMGF